MAPTVGLTKNTDALKGTLSGVERIPDFWDRATNTIMEVKNVSYVSYTSQIEDMARWAANPPGASFQLWVRKGATLSETVQKAWDAGAIQVNWFTWP